MGAGRWEAGRAGGTGGLEGLEGGAAPGLGPEAMRNRRAGRWIYPGWEIQAVGTAFLSRGEFVGLWLHSGIFCY